MSRPRVGQLRTMALLFACTLLATCTSDNGTGPSTPPALTSLSPAAGVEGTTVRVAISGSDFVAGATTVTVAGGGVDVRHVSVTSASSLAADFVVAPDAALGERDVSVTTSGGTSGTTTFTVDPPAPGLTSLDPPQGADGATVHVTLIGTHFVADGTSVDVAGGGVDVRNPTVESATSLRADFVIHAGAAPGTRDVTITTAGGTTEARTFTVEPPAPTLTGMTPASEVVGTTTDVTLTGTNFVTGATVRVSEGDAAADAGVTVSDVAVVSRTTITASLAVAGDASPGERSVTVTTPGGTSDARSFAVVPPAPTLTGVDPSRGARGAAAAVTLTGTNFVAGATVAVGGAGVAVSGVTVAGSTSMTATFTVAGDAALGDRDVTVTTPGGTTEPRTFTVEPPAPTLGLVQPWAGAPGSTVRATLSGTSFTPDATVDVSGGGVEVSDVAFVSATSMSATFTVAAGAASGDRQVTVTTPGGASNPFTFSVLRVAPPRVAGTVGSGGGTVGFSDGRFELDVPAGALPQDTRITITELTGSDIPPELRNPAVKKVYKMEPDGLVFASPATVTVHTAGSPAPPGGVPVIALLSDHGGTTELLGSASNSVDGSGITATAAINHFSSVAEVDDFSVEFDLSVTPGSLPVGDDFTLRADMALTGEGETPRSATISGAARFLDLSSGGLFFPAPIDAFHNFYLESGTTDHVSYSTTGTCSRVGSFDLRVDINATDLGEFVAEGLAGYGLVTFVSRHNSDAIIETLTVSVDCTAPPPPPPPPPPSSTPTVATGVHAAPAGLTHVEDMSVVSDLQPVVVPAAPPRAARAGPSRAPAAVTSTPPTFGPFTSDGGPIGAFSGAEGEAIVDLATGRVLADRTGGNPLFGVVGLSQDPPGPTSPAALIEFGPGVSFGTNLMYPYFPGDAYFSAPLIYAGGVDVFDVWPVGGTTVSDAAVFVKPVSSNGVGLITFDPNNPIFGVPGYWFSGETLSLGSASTGLPYSAYVATLTGPALILASNGATSNGDLVLNDRSGGTNGGVTTLVGHVGKDPRKLRCLAGVCAVTNFADGTLTIVLWDGATTPTVAGTVTVGSGPVDLGLVQLANGDVGIVSTGFNDDTYSETEVAPDGSLVSTVTTPVPAGCTQPGHAHYLTDNDGLKVLATCYGSDNWFAEMSALNGR